jgi:hypothetical protein
MAGAGLLYVANGLASTLEGGDRDEEPELPDTEVFSRGESIALWVGVVLFVALLSCVLYRLCRVTVQ